MWETSHPLSFAVAGYAIAASIMPNLVLIAAGHLVGSIPAAAAGIAHLEDPKVLDDLALAQGQLTGQLPADAPMTLALAAGGGRPST
jgi:ATP-binding cassette, subfamily B, bacterial